MAFKSSDPAVRAMMARAGQAEPAKARAQAECHGVQDTLTITLPLPGKLLSPNARPHYMALYRAKDSYRKMADRRATLALAGARPLWTTATIQATFYHAQRRGRDRDNLNASLKSTQDGLADAGLILNDKGVTNLPPIQLIDRDRPRVELTITRSEP